MHHKVHTQKMELIAVKFISDFDRGNKNHIDLISTNFKRQQF